jgi:hypothetical protein
MIKDESFSRGWILTIKSKPEYSMADPGLIEKMIYALYAVELLKYFDLNFIFKGGTCLTIMFQELRRFSIDVDIITEEKKEIVEEVLSRMVSNSKFTKYEPDRIRSSVKGLPIGHYNLFYKSSFSNEEKVILLDVLFDKNPYDTIQSIRVENDLLSVDDSEIKVTAPSVNGITADKLTAFAPTTIGIPYKANKELQIIKQLFDIGFLCNKIDNMNYLKQTFIKVSEAQCRYRNINYSIDEILLDTIGTAFILAMQNRNKDESKIKFDELHRGIHSLNSYIPRSRFNLNHAIELSAKAALLAAKLKTNSLDKFPITEHLSYKPSVYPITPGIYHPVGRMIKNIPNLSQFYWHHIAALLH